jgi:pseudaminic acid biosynthesis-associated methylase
MTETAEFWSGSFGDEYGRRNNPKWEDRVPFWKDIVEATNAESFLDVGCNRGFNLLALRSLNPGYVMSGVDVNQSALQEAMNEGLDVIEGRADEVSALFGPGSADMVITSGVLIHIAPEDLTASMQAIVTAAKKFVIAIEYESDTAEEVLYRGHKGRLWKRPYGRLYEALGMKVVEYQKNAQGFDQCAAWILSK